MLLAAAGPSLARDDAALKAAAEAYVHHPVTQQVIDGMWSGDTMRSFVTALSRAQGANFRRDQTEALTRIVREELDRIRPQVESLMTKAVIETFTLEEVRALNAFYDTEPGASATVKSGKILRSFNAGAAPVLMGMFKRLGERVKAEFPK